MTHDVTLRTGPATSYPQIAVIPAGATVPVGCSTQGETITDIYGPDSTWDHVSYNGATGFVTDEWVNTQGATDDKALIPDC